MATVIAAPAPEGRDEHVNGNGQGVRKSIAARLEKNGAVQEVERRTILVPAHVAASRISGRELMEAIQKSLGTVQNIVAETKDILRGVEANIRASELIQLNEKPDGERTLTLQRKFRFCKDR